MPTPKRPRRDKRRPSTQKGFLVTQLYSSSVTSDDKLGAAAQRMFDVVGVTEARKFLKEWFGGRLVLTALSTYAYVSKSKGTVFNEKSAPWLSKKGTYGLSRVISSSLAAYRTMCLFPGSVILSVSEDVPVALFLKHTVTGQVLCITEWRGAFRLMSLYGPKKSPKPFVRDTARLMNILINPRCPHPYSGLVAGNVA